MHAAYRHVLYAGRPCYENSNNGNNAIIIEVAKLYYYNYHFVPHSDYGLDVAGYKERFFFRPGSNDYLRRFPVKTSSFTSFERPTTIFRLRASLFSTQYLVVFYFFFFFFQITTFLFMASFEKRISI